MSGFKTTRTFREGAVGLIFLIGLGAFGVIFLWLNRVTPGRSSYQVIVEFADAGGMQKGDPVRYRGVKVGSIARMTTKPNAVEVELEINDPNLLIPADSRIEANQSGLISESIVDITPIGDVTLDPNTAKPLDKDCNPGLIICHQSGKLRGQIGTSVDRLIRQSSDFADKYGNKEFYDNVNRLLITSTDAAASIAKLSRELQVASRSFQGEVGKFSDTAVTIQRATNELTATTKQTAAQINTTAGDFSTTAKQAGKLINNLDDLLTTNRSALVSTLNNINETSNQLRQTVNALSPAVTRLTQGDILKNLEILSANAAEASISLKDASKTLADPKNIVLLQQTLDAARVTFENTQKITSDLDELTGDPKFRQNLLQLVNGLNKLLSSTGDMQEQTKVALTLDSIKLSINQGSSQSKSETTSDLGVSNHGVKAEKLEKQENRVVPSVIVTPNPVIEITPVPELLPEPVLPSSQEP
ncbi:MCE family protein [Cylindrospermopsis raciborskii CENA303]|uniref:MCE family protein n=1 Tax=Cylindrospermopsis raciborskii CENA303 TaxID=1170769 RepID=A0A1X4G5D8_9CYAN|nr:MlaD family protein [Cylindrospermopsis raciborskii]EFA73789.1 conserved hypothetical protein [Raphidiopsis brookii D9]OSO89786.1 MCE family protein [Cylindrospermopsis raciborskii CENA303]